MDRFRTPNSRKRLWSEESEDDGTDGHQEKRRRDKPTSVNDGNEPREVIVLDDDDDLPTIRRGRGTEQDPCLIMEWVTGSLISKSGHGNYLVISDDEGEESETASPRQSVRTSSPTPIEQGSTHSSDRAGQALRRQESLSSITQEANATSPAPGSLDVTPQKSIMSPLEAGNHHFLHPLFDRSPTNSPLPFSEHDEEGDLQDCANSAVEDKPSFELSQQPWTCITKEQQERNPEVSLPDLTFSQDTVSSETLEDSTPSPDESLTDRTKDERRQTLVCAIPIDSQAELLESSPHFEDDMEWEKKMPVEERKRLFYNIYWHSQKPVLQGILARYHHGVEGDMEPNECWLYKGRSLPPFPKRTISIDRSFIHNGRSEKLYVNVVIMAMLLKGTLTDEEKNGIINSAWEASHLCGNWTCLNHSHVIAEPRPTNISRNSCFRAPTCSHTPPCRKHLKLEGELLRPRDYRPVSKRQKPKDEAVEGSINYSYTCSDGL